MSIEFNIKYDEANKVWKASGVGSMKEYEMVSVSLSSLGKRLERLVEDHQILQALEDSGLLKEWKKNS